MNSNYVIFTAIDGVQYVRGPQGQFPMTEDNADYRTFLAWLADGNQPEIIEP